MNKEELNKLILKAQEGDKESLDFLVNKNMGLVYMMAKRYKIKDRVDDYEGTISEGIIGLIVAIKKYDASRGSAFSTYACHSIHGFMNNYITGGYASSNPIRMTKRWHYIASDIIKFKEKYMQENNSEPTINDICENVSHKDKDIRKVIDMDNTVLSLEYDYVNEYDGNTLFRDFIGDEKCNVEDYVINKMIISQYIQSLKPKEQMAIKLRYYDGLPMSKVADKLKMTKNGIYLLEIRVLDKLKNMIGSDEYETSMDFKKRA